MMVVIVVVTDNNISIIAILYKLKALIKAADLLLRPVMNESPAALQTAGIGVHANNL